METISLSIPNMKSAHCQMAVTQAVKAVGAEIRSISAMNAEVALGNGATKDAVILAIEKAGYTVTNGTNKHQ